MKQMRMMDEHMARIPKTQFADPQSLPYNVFVRLGADHFIMVGRTGTPSTIHRLKAFEADLVPWFYVQRGDYTKYIDQTVDKAIKTHDEPSVDEGTRLASVGTAIASVMELVRIGGFTPSAWNAVQQLSVLVQKTAMSTTSMATLMASMQQLGEIQTRHAVGVSLIAMLLGRESKMADEDVLNLGMAGLLHDIGWVKLPPDLITKREDLLRGEELKIYQSHCYEGAHLLRECSQVPSDVITMVYEHHENALGTGFPRQLSGERTHKLSLMLGLAERFCELTIGDGMHHDRLTPIAATNTIANVEGHPFPMEHLKLLEHLIQADVKKA